jgi:hypothetical protein
VGFYRGVFGLPKKMNLNLAKIQESLFFWALSSFKELSPKLYVSSMLAGVPKTVLRVSDLNTLAWPAYEKRKIHP